MSDEFKETPIGKIPKEWDVKPIIEIVEKIKAGGTPKTSVKEYYGGGIPFVKIEDLTSCNKYLEKTKITITQQGLENSSSWIVPPGSLLFAMYGSIGASAINKVPVATNQAILGIIPKRDIVDVEFLYYLLTYSKPRFELMALQTTQANLNAGIVKATKIPLPPLPEQRKIAEILSTIDKAIEKTDALIHHYQQLKNALMQKLFTEGIGHTKFKSSPLGQIPAEWEVVKFGDISEFKNGINFKGDLKGDVGILTVDVLNMYGEGIYLDMSNLYRVNMEVKENYLLQRGDILIVRSSLKQEGVGWASMFNGYHEPVTFCGFLIRARMKEEYRDTVLPEFLVYYLRSDISRGMLISTSGKVAITNISQGLLKQLNIPLPPLEEQKKIAQILMTIDNKIEAEMRTKEELEKLKHGMMDKLLTGKVRVKVGEESG